MIGAGPPPRPDGYPARLEADVVVKDGATVHIRPIQPSDADGITALHQRLSAETIYFRFFSPLARLSPKLLDRFVRVDYRDRLALVAELGDDLIAVGRYERLASGLDAGTDAEVAFLVDDAHQGRGLGTVLLEHLVAAARAAGISRFVADTLSENRRMLRVFHDAGFDDEQVFADGVVRVVFPIAATDASVAATEERERLAASSSVRRLLAPRSVAVVGASRDPDSLGWALVKTLLGSDFNGPVYPVNPAAGHVASVRAYPTVAEIPDVVDLAVVVVPAAAVADVVGQCARKHVGGLVVISAGFAELGEEGTAAERRLVAEARRNGMRLIGPNSMGVINTDPQVRLNATFSPLPTPGRIGVVAQSGGLGVAILDEIGRRRLGISTFVSAGNKADVSGNDLLQYWDDDPTTDVVLMYIESFGNPRTFARVARRVSRRKPIVAVKSGRSPAGTRAAGYHRARQDDQMVDALFMRAGVIRTDTLEELFDVAQVLSCLPLPAGRRVAIVGTNGGPGVLAADACEAAGLEMAELGARTRRRLREALPGVRAGNPVGLPPDSRPEALSAALEAVLPDDGIDSVIAIYTSPPFVPLELVAAAISDARTTAPAKPIVACALGRRQLIDTGIGRRPIASFAFPESAARALGLMTDYAEWLRRPSGDILPFDDVDTAGARRLVAAALTPPVHPSGRWLDPRLVAELLAYYGISSEGARRLDNQDLQIGVVQDPLFGPLVTLAAAGAPSAARGPARAARALPITDLDARHLVRQAIRSPVEHPDGPADEDATAAAIEDVVLRVGRLAGDLPELIEMALPLGSRPSDDDGGGPDGSAVDRPTGPFARVRLAPFEGRPELALRRLH